MMGTRLSSVRNALLTLPDARGWTKLGGTYLAFLVVASLVGFGSGFFRFGLPAMEPKMIFALPLVLLVRPALVEEIGFRGLLVPHPLERRPLRVVILSAIASLALYVAWHPLNGLLFRPAQASLFLDPVFLTLAFTLGVVCTVAYLLSGSLWPPVLIHWISVTLWIELLGGGERLSYGVASN